MTCDLTQMYFFFNIGTVLFGLVQARTQKPRGKRLDV